MLGLPMYLLRLATEVDWESEEECFSSFCRVTAQFLKINKEYANKEEKGV